VRQQRQYWPNVGIDFTSQPPSAKTRVTYNTPPFLNGLLPIHAARVNSLLPLLRKGSGCRDQPHEFKSPQTAELFIDLTAAGMTSGCTNGPSDERLAISRA